MQPQYASLYTDHIMLLQYLDDYHGAWDDVITKFYILVGTL